MTVRQTTWDEVDNPCVQCKKLGLDDQVPEKCPFVIILTDGMEDETEAINRRV